MKKNIFTFAFCLTLSVSTVFAATPSFSSPILTKAYEQINLRIDQKINKIILDENGKKAVEQKKTKLSEILVAIDKAFQKKDKATIQTQVKLFRDTYKETVNLVTSLENTKISSNNQTTENTKISGKATDITYYADSFEGGHTGNGNPFSQSFYSAAACNILINSLAQIGNGNTAIIVKVNDRPNCTKYPALTDLTTTAFKTLGKVSTGKIKGTITALGTVPKDYLKRIIPTNTFEQLGITLDANIPNTYLKNETFHVEGKELLGKEYTIFYLQSPSGKDITLGAKKGSDGRFTYNHTFEEVGTYALVIASGNDFKTTTYFDITVLDDSVLSAKTMNSGDTSEKLETLNIERIEAPDLSPTFFFHFSPEYFHSLTISGNGKNLTYKGFGIIAIKGDVFKTFDMDTPVVVKVTSQKSSTVFSHDTYTNPIVIFNRTMTLTPGYKAERNENITVTEDDGELVIRGIIQKGKNVKSNIFLTLPNGNVEEYSFDSSSIDTDKNLKREKVFEKIIPLKQSGLYLVEVNYDNGFPAYNGPVIYGEMLPVYPNAYDSVKKEISKTDISIAATESLSFVNDIRLKSEKSTLSLDDTLNTLATIKANDMAEHKNLSHTDSNGDKINGTAKRSGIELVGGIGENIAGGNVSFKALLIGLANSGGHRANMLDDWKKMGVGYALKDGQLYYVQVFGE